MMDDAASVDGSSPVEEPSHGGDWDTAARIVRLLEVVQQYAVLDFADLAPVADTGDDLDALAAGINMLGEELDGWNRDFHQRVDQRTTELNESVRQLQRFNQQLGELTEMSNLLQAAVDREEAFTVLGRSAPEIFADASGAIYTYPHSRGQLEAATRWGPHQEQFASRITADGCCALRHGRMHQGHDVDTVCCDHLSPGVTGRSLCVPFAVQGVIVGVLSIHDDTNQQADDQAHTPGPAVASANERLALAASEQFTLAVTNLELRNELRVQSINDALTGLYNRRYLDETLARELRRAHRTGTPVSVLMIDIDHFKNLNDTHGHAAGDAMLIELAAVLLNNIRSEDIGCRYGGEEFAVIMAGLDRAGAVQRAEQLRNNIAAHEFTRNEQPLERLTASIGVATSPQHGHTTDQLLNAADTALYHAKSNGRNRVETAT